MHNIYTKEHHCTATRRYTLKTCDTTTQPTPLTKKHFLSKWNCSTNDNTSFGCIKLLLVEFYNFNHNTGNSNTFTTIYCLDFILWYTDICTFYCHRICKHLGSHNVHIYWMYLQYGLWFGLMMARWAETYCQIYRLIIKLFVLFRLNVIMFIWYLWNM